MFGTHGNLGNDVAHSAGIHRADVSALFQVEVVALHPSVACKMRDSMLAAHPSSYLAQRSPTPMTTFSTSRQCKRGERFRSMLTFRAMREYSSTSVGEAPMPAPSLPLTQRRRVLRPSPRCPACLRVRSTSRRT